MKRLIRAFGVVVVLGLFVTAAVPAQPVYAAGGGCNERLLTLPTWYKGLTKSDCSLKSPTEKYGNTKDALSKYIWLIALNIIEIMLQLVAYISVGFIIYGGFIYIVGAGSSDKLTSAKKTITNAIIGLVLSSFAVAIVTLVGQNIK